MSEETIRDLAQALGNDKDVLLDDIERRIRWGVKSLGSDCFSVIEEKAGYQRTKYDPPSPDWGKRFVLFCRKKNHKGNALDSPVTDRVSNEVSAAFLEYYQDKSEDISAIVARDFAKDEAFVGAIVDAIHDTNVVKASEWMTKKMIEAQIRAVVIAALQSAQIQAIGSQIASVTTALIAKVAASSVGTIISKQLLLYSKVVVAKILASAAFKTMVAAAIKKFAAAAILATVTHALWGLLGAKVAAAIGSAIVPIIAVAILGWVVYEIVNMPEKLGDKLAVEVRAKLDREMNNINRQMASNIYEQIGGSFGGLAASLATNDAFIEALNSCVGSAESEETTIRA
uniref:Uncharacterized protein n=1 Tax=Candidatus Kentrum sp. MB TaxID=2138164 RepID=A0A450XFD0_9GAMM|nr:MAG: hypothetical protein BECKMB1821G_GA0114241_10323 [Candidatus Kentron sp. MB]VFK29311.1 MAG: hypothetical protein BECKMB1821I_GA0114274_100927 [Candidatus Kentron sp. MB]VFK74742.1 MAG: hypothetical protein BECKMB1821H_GA0114242_100927 [Candidatus Kentron sp. MB]